MKKELVQRKMQNLTEKIRRVADEMNSGVLTNTEGLAKIKETMKQKQEIQKMCKHPDMNQFGYCHDCHFYDAPKGEKLVSFSR